MNVPFENRAQIEGIPGGGSWIAQTLSKLIAAIGASWDVQHTADGAHGTITLGSLTGPKLIPGVGSPEGVITAPMGSIYLRSDGGTSTTLYVKTSGAGATGWTAK